MSTHDELAGVVDLFGALTHEELEQALVELAFKQGKDVQQAAFESAIEDAIADYHLVETGDGMLAVGPVAFPALPENGADLPHILDIEKRDVDRETVGAAVHGRLREEAAAAAASEDTERAAYLLDVSYDLEAWAPVDASDVRAQVDPVIG